MELQALYELHERMCAAAVAGVNLMGEDFRLRRAVEQIRPLAEAVPVIKKLYVMAEMLMAPDQEDRAGCLLDALALSEAILCTQAGYKAEEEGKTLELVDRDHGPCRPYSQVAPLEKALTESGGGRLVPITEAIEQRPWLFSDYRLEAAVITALADRYGDIADTAERFLETKNGQILPLLKRGFEETTENGRIRRLKVMETIGGGSENGFYLDLLNTAKKELRAEAIHALRFDDSNVSVLLDLVRTEKGTCLLMAEQVLGMMDSDAADCFWEKKLEEKPRETVDFLRFSRSDLVSDRMAGLMEAAFYEKGETGSRKEWDQWIHSLILAMPGKGSLAMQDMYRKAAKGSFPHREIQRELSSALTDSIIYSGDERLVALAGELAALWEKVWLGPVFAADLLTRPAGEVYDTYRNKIPRDSFLGKEEKRNIRKMILSVLGKIHCSKEDGEYRIYCRMEEAAGDRKAHILSRALYERPDPRWLDLLMEDKVFGEDRALGIDSDGRYQDMGRDTVLFGMTPPHARAELGAYLHKRALAVKDNRELLRLLVLCGWKDFSGLVAAYVKKNPETGVSLWSLQHEMNGLFMTAEQQQKEIRDIDEFLCGFPKNSAARKNWDGSDYHRNAVNRAAGL